MGVALGTAAVWAVTLRKVEALAGTRNKSLVPSPPPPPSKKQVAVGLLPPKHGVDKAGLVAGSGSGAGAEGKTGADGGLRRREIRGEVDSDASFANGRPAAAVHTNGNGKTLARKEL